MIFLSLILACSEKTTDPAEDVSTDTGVSTSGGLALRFMIDEDYAALMQEPPNGVFYGSFWHGDEVNSLGPMDGAESIVSIQVSMNLPTDGSATEVLYTVEDLPIETVYLLGFLDSDGNADPESTDPDSKDPVTLPSDNDFDVIGGQISEVSVYMGMLYP